MRMEFPDLGEQCAVKSCRMLDFLPVRCSGCHKVFCKDHYIFESHSCPVGNGLERQVPVCPLCGVPVPIGPNECADFKVGHHIDTACKSQPALALKGKIFKNACSVPRCKKKELVPLCCERCHLNYCISHRNELDHNCTGIPAASTSGKRMSITGAAAIRRAVARQFNNSFNSNSAALSKTQQEEVDRQLALAIAASMEAEEKEDHRRQRQQASASSDNGCSVS
ncbi:AN1-type zinc finger protein 2B [Taenia crassiceps]|uniref:AN1-type zinc finger protein 2B n=1 Tax=Taenia crassiceps TaxID=6207 RepID=A0ABR4QPG5_9CEST